MDRRSLLATAVPLFGHQKTLLLPDRLNLISAPLIFQLVQCAVVMEVRRNALKAPKRGSGDLDTPLNWSPARF